ncbi:MAG: HupE/UreJ family protein, partial [Pseudomonadota bacterium]
MRRLPSTVIALCVLLWSGSAQAHKQSDSYLTLTATTDSPQLQGRWDIALRDLDFVLGLDADADERITWGEVRARRAAIEQYAFARLALEPLGEGGGVCTLRPQQLLIDEHVDGAYAVLEFIADCSAATAALRVNYSLLFTVDPNHHGLLDFRGPGFNQTLVLSSATPALTLDLRQADGWQQFRSFVTEGIWHIWQGYDHILFLITLLLPAVVVHRNGRWQARASWREAAADILKVVTAFTLAHSLTLSLAALGVVQAPSRLVESAIALTVLLGALNILFPVVRERRWLVALGFGLIHGLGFASVLADLGLTGGALVRALIGFNLGVEAGQVVIVAILMPLIYLLRGTVFYRRLALPVGATAISVLALYWIALRALPEFMPA